MKNVINLTKTFELKTLRSAARAIDVSVAAVPSGGYFLIDCDGSMLGVFEPPVPWSFEDALGYIDHYSRMQSEGLTDDRELVVELMARSFGIRVVAVEGAADG